MGKEGNAPENKRIPERDGMMLVDLIKQKLLQSQIIGDEIRSMEQMAAEKDIPENIKAYQDKNGTQKKLFSKRTL